MLLLCYRKCPNMQVLECQMKMNNFAEPPTGVFVLVPRQRALFTEDFLTLVARIAALHAVQTVTLPRLPAALRVKAIGVVRVSLFHLLRKH